MMFHPFNSVKEPLNSFVNPRMLLPVIDGLQHDSLSSMRCSKFLHMLKFHWLLQDRLYHLESRWLNSHVLVYHIPLLSHLLGVAPSTFRIVYFFHIFLLSIWENPSHVQANKTSVCCLHHVEWSQRIPHISHLMANWSFVNWNFRTIYPTTNPFQEFVEAQNHPKSLEVSMISAHLLDTLDQCGRVCRGVPTVPFGNLPVLLCWKLRNHTRSANNIVILSNVHEFASWEVSGLRQFSKFPNLPIRWRFSSTSSSCYGWLGFPSKGRWSPFWIVMPCNKKRFCTGPLHDTDVLYLACDHRCCKL